MAGEPKTIQSSVNRRDLIGQVRQKWLEPSADRPGGMVSAAFLLAVVIEILFKRAGLPELFNVVGKARAPP
jgi:hypothetical protein